MTQNLLSSFDEFVKSRNSIEFVIPANPGSSPGQAPESSYFKMFWTPAFAGVTTKQTSYETINFPQGKRIPSSSIDHLGPHLGKEFLIPGRFNDHLFF